MGGAHALLKEDRIGSLETGKYADFIVLDRNLLEIPVDDISESEVLKTVFNGKVVYDQTGCGLRKLQLIGGNKLVNPSPNTASRFR